MVNQRFQAIYMAAVVVVCIGLLGTVFVPKSHADAWKKHSVVTTLEPTIQQRMFSSSKPLVGFASLGLLSSVGLALLYSKNKAY